MTLPTTIALACAAILLLAAICVALIVICFIAIGIERLYHYFRPCFSGKNIISN